MNSKMMMMKKLKKTHQKKQKTCLKNKKSPKKMSSDAAATNDEVMNETKLRWTMPLNESSKQRRAETKLENAIHTMIPSVVRDNDEKRLLGNQP